MTKIKCPFPIVCIASSINICPTTNHINNKDNAITDLCSMDLLNFV